MTSVGGSAGRSERAGRIPDFFLVGPEGGVGVDGALVLAKLLRVNQRDQLGAEDLEVDPLVGRKLVGVQRVDLKDDIMPVLEVSLLLGSSYDREFGQDAVGVVLILCSPLRFAPGVFRVVDGLQTKVFCRGLCGDGGFRGLLRAR